MSKSSGLLSQDAAGANGMFANRAVAMKKIMIVEDEGVIALDMAGQLREFGLVVTGIADNCEAATRMAEKTTPDLVVMDIQIKGATDGIDTALKIRERENVPVVFLSAYRDPRTMERIRHLASHEFLQKPYRPHDLLAAIEGLLSAPLPGAAAAGGA